jgi:protein O-GlcNAc transferase
MSGAVLQAALERHRVGDLRGAEQLYRQILREVPDDPDALYLLGAIALQSGQPENALDPIRRSLALKPQAIAHINLGVALQQLRRLPEALGCFESALCLDPASADAHNNRGDVLLELGEPAQALASLERALALAPRFALALNNCGNALKALGRLEAALESYDRALALEPHSARVLNNRGSLLRDLGRLDAALMSFEHALRNEPNHVLALYNRGNLLLELARFEPALQSYDQFLSLRPQDADALTHRAIALLGLRRAAEALASLDGALSLQPHMPLALNNRGNALRLLGRFEEALSAYERALAATPTSVEVLSNCGNVLLDLHQPADALQCYEAALQFAPQSPDLLCRRGDALVLLGRTVEALASCQQALQLQPEHEDALFNVGVTLIELKRFTEAVPHFQTLVTRNPNYAYARGHLLHARLRICDWRDLEPEERELVRAVTAGARADLPFSFLAVTDSAEAQLHCARTLMADRHTARPGVFAHNPWVHDRLRVAYVSGDLRSHAVGRLIVGVLERHDRRRFEVSAIALRPPEASTFGERLLAAFDRFIDVSRRSDAEIAALMRDMQIDIAIDLGGFTETMRPEIFARRCAPVQVNYVGYPGTLGASQIDYIIADEFMIPPALHSRYVERVAYLPDCFQPTDDRRPVPQPASREALGLPPQAPVCCSFNNSFKYNERMFDVWARILRRAPRAVLWLLADDDAAGANLRRHAGERGIGDRLVLSRRSTYDEYLARLACADLFLDTLPFNAGATASDALWAGLPIITCAGEAFASRMAGSLLRAAGLGELVTSSLEDYEARAADLLASPARLLELRRRTEAARTRSALFDTEQHCRALESAFEIMWQRSRRGERPSPLAIARAELLRAVAGR